MYLKLRNMRLRRRLSYDMAVRIAAIFRAKPDTIFYQEHINNQDNSSAIEE